MSSRLGRNPFEKKKTSVQGSARAPSRAVDIIQEMESPNAKPRLRESIQTGCASPAGLAAKIARFLFVDARAEGYLFALKAYLLSISVFE